MSVFTKIKLFIVWEYTLLCVSLSFSKPKHFIPKFYINPSKLAHRQIHTNCILRLHLTRKRILCMPLVKVFLLSIISAYEYIHAWIYILYDYTFPSNEIIIKKYIHNCMILSFKHFSEEFSYKVEKYSVTCVQRMKCWWNTVVRSHYLTKTWCSGLTQPFFI